MQKAIILFFILASCQKEPNICKMTRRINITNKEIGMLNDKAKQQIREHNRQYINTCHKYK